MSNMNITVTGELWAAFLCFMAFLVMVLYKKKTAKDLCVRRMMFVCTLLLASDAATWHFDGLSGSAVRAILYVSNYLLYASSYLIVGLFIGYMWQMAKRDNEQFPVLFKVFWAGVAVSIAALTVGIFFNLYFYFDESNVYHRSDLYLCSQLITVLGVVTLAWATATFRKRLTKYELIAALSYFILPPLGTVIQAFHYGIACQQFAFAAATLITFYVREADIRSELQETMNRDFKSRQELQEKLDIVSSIATTYASIYYIDMTNMTYIELGESGEYVRKIIGSGGDAVHAMDLMCKHIITPDQAEDMRVFTDFGTLNARLKDRSWISRQFQAGSGRWNEGIFVVVKRDEQGNLRNVIWAVRDINDMKLLEIEYQKELEKARDTADAASAAKTTFLFNMSHDIRTPMNAIIGYTDLIEKHYDDKARCMDYLHKTQQSNHFLLSLINDVLEMARIESGKAQLEEVVSPVGGIARELSAIFEDQMKQKGIHYVSRVETHTEWAFCDPAKVREIYLNILSNALKYTPKGGTVSMQVSEFQWDRPGYIGIKAVFSDTGIGMSEEFLPHLFEAFSRERSATESRQQGTGLGMPIVKKIIDLMGGTIDVKSAPGKGSTFTVTYPLKAEGAVPVKEAKEPKPEDIDFTGRRILLAEDNDLNAEIAIAILSEAGFILERAEDGLICIAKLKEAEDYYYDLILMDIQMPNLDGYEATRRIRAMQNKAKAEIPIIAMTANAFESDRQDALKAGMNGHVAKPIEIPKLMDTINECMNS